MWMESGDFEVDEGNSVFYFIEGFIKIMFDQLNIQTQNQHPPLRPGSPSNNRLRSYFGSSNYLNRQEEISVFISNFPKINLSELKSPNTLIALLIKQNQLLGQKCQQQVVLIKQSFLKHDNIMKMNKELKQKMEQKEMQALQIRQQHALVQKQREKLIQIESNSRKLEAQCRKLQTEIKQGEDRTKQILRLVEYICCGNYKRCEQYVRQNNIARVDKAGVEMYCQKERRKNKYFGKVKSCTKEFCSRLNKVVEVVSAGALATELHKETAGFLDLIDQLITCSERGKKKKTEKSLGSDMKNSVSSIDFSYYQSENNFFEKMLTTLSQSAMANNQTKQQIALELEQVKKSLLQSKSYYESYVDSLRASYENDKKQIDNKLHLRQETINYYEQELEKLKENVQKYEQENRELESDLMAVKRDRELLELELQERNAVFEQKILEMEQEKKKNKQEWQEKMGQVNNFNEIKVKQRDDLLRESQQRRKRQKEEHEQEIHQIKHKINKSEEQVSTRSNELKQKIQEFNELENKLIKTQKSSHEKTTLLQTLQKELTQYKVQISKLNKQILLYKQAQNQAKHEQQLQSSYIHELQSKSDALQSKLKTVESKQKQQHVNKKEVLHLKDCLMIQREKNEGLETYAQRHRDENQKLKIMIKQMKKELEDVYVRVQELKEIEKHRQKLAHQMHQSEKEKADWFKQYEGMKVDLLRIDAENKKSALELKHYRNIVMRIKGGNYISD